MSLIPITREEHGSKRWLRRESFAFAQQDSAIPLVASEAPAAALTMPVAFLKQGDAYQLIGLMGLVSQQNLFVSETGAWLGSYIPAEYRAGPFRLAKGPDEELIVCFAADSGLINDGHTGERFFEANGELTPDVKQIIELLSKLSGNQILTVRACEAIAKHDLFEPWPITAGETRVEGVYRINETALDDLPESAFIELRDAHALPLIYSQLISTQNIHKLIQMLSQRTSYKANAASVMSETFSFSNL